MGARGLALFAAGAAVATILSIPLLDRPFAEWQRAAGLDGLAPFGLGTILLDTLLGVTLSKFLLAALLLAAGVALLAVTRLRTWGVRLLFVGACHSASTFLSGAAKGPFGRLRPHELFAGGDWDAAWFAGGHGFPSGHAGFYFGLFLPLAVLYPRWRWALLVPPFFIALARVNGNHHFVSDVTGSMALAAAITLGGLLLAGRRLGIPGERRADP